MNRSVPLIAASAALITGATLAGCTAKDNAATTTSGTNAAGAPAELTVTATDTTCELSATQGTTGANTFQITNNGNKVTEFYVYGEGERVMGEVENISPGLSRKLIVQLTEPGTYQTACKPGMVGDGIRGDFTVTGEAVKIDTEGKFKEAADSYKRYVNSQTDALIPATQVFVDAVKKGDVAAAKAQFPIARTYYERIEPVAESFPDDLDPRIDLREADLEPGQKWTSQARATASRDPQVPGARGRSPEPRPKASQWTGSFRTCRTRSEEAGPRLTGNAGRWCRERRARGPRASSGGPRRPPVDAKARAERRRPVRLADAGRTARLPAAELAHRLDRRRRSPILTSVDSRVSDRADSPSWSYSDRWPAVTAATRALVDGVRR